MAFTGSGCTRSTRARCRICGRIEKGRAGDVIDVGPIEEPRIAAEIDLFVARAEFSGEHGLNARQQPCRNDRLAFERLLRGLELRGAREEMPKIPRAPHRPDFRPRGQYLVDIEGRQAAGRPRRTELDRELDRGNRNDGEEKERDEQPTRARGVRRCA